MFLGHYAVGLASKQFAPRSSLGALIAAPILLDLLWSIFLLLGWERVAIVPNSNPFLRLEFESFPISHGLIAVLGWATLYASIYYGVTRYVQGSVVIWFGVLSHWVMDWIVHTPDLQIYAQSKFFGYGLWQHRWLTIALECGLFAIGIWVYQTRTKPRDEIGLIAFIGFVGFLLLAYAGAAFAPPPPTVKKLAIITLLTGLMILWGWWMDRHRSDSSEVAGR
jgi:hypothetical protein